VRLLLDTHVLLWQLQGARTLPAAARRAIGAASELVVSVVSFAEVGIKVAVGKLRVPSDLHEQVLRSGVRILALAPDHGLAVAELPLHHRDPFDRLLISQARREGLAIVTADRRFAAYDVTVIDAAESRGVSGPGTSPAPRGWRR
jgi:PIN domain nuclease of toxin-antitoxin system